MRVLFPAVFLAILVACEPVIPDSGAGVGIASYDAYRSEVEAELTGTPVPLSDASQEGQLTSPADIEGRAVAEDTLAALGAPISALSTDSQSAMPVSSSTQDLSDEQDFAAVSARESIESDRERLAAQQQEFQEVAAQALPVRSGDSGPNVVAFALSTSNAVGQALYRRVSLFADSRLRRNCAKYASPDLAQEDFLRLGGPQSDRRGLDPDGDGFACAWDPTPFRRVSSN